MVLAEAHAHAVLNDRVGIGPHEEPAVGAGVDAQLVREDVDGAVGDALEVHRGAARAQMDLAVGGVLDAHGAQQTRSGEGSVQVM